MPSLLRRLLSTCACLALATGLEQVTSPEAVGLDSGKLRELMVKLQEQVDTGQLPGAALTIIRGGKVAFRGAVGFANRETGARYRTDTIVRLLSQSKPVTAVATMILVEEGTLGLDDPLWKYHHGFRRMLVDVGNGRTVPAERDITIRDLLLHTAGLGYGVPGGGGEGLTDSSPLALAALPFTTLKAFVDALATQPLIAQPGARWSYSWSYDVLGYVIQKVTRLPPDEFMRRRIFEPLGMTDTGFYVPYDKISRFSAAYSMSPEGQLTPLLRPRLDPLMSYRSLPFISGGSGLVSTADDYARFGLMLVNGGELDGVRILRPETVDMMWRNSLAKELLPISLNGWASDAYTGWGFGWTVSCFQPVADMDWSDKTGPRRAGLVGWGGGALTNWMASVQSDIVVSFVTQRLALPMPPLFQQIVMTGVFSAMTGPSGRAAGGSPDGSVAEEQEEEETPEDRRNVRGGRGKKPRERPVKPRRQPEEDVDVDVEDVLRGIFGGGLPQVAEQYAGDMQVQVDEAQRDAWLEALSEEAP